MNILTQIMEYLFRKYSSLKVKLLLLMFISFVPILFVMLYADMKERKAIELNTKKELESFSLLTKNNVNHFVESTRKLLVTISHSSAVQKNDTALINTYFKKLMFHFPDYVNIGLSDLKGNIIYSAVALQKPVNSYDLYWFKHVLETKEFSIGEYQTDRFVEHDVLVLSLPVFDEKGNLKSIVYISIELNWLNKLIENVNLSKDYIFVISDRNKTILTKYPDSNRWTGKKLFQSKIPEGCSTYPDTILETDKMDGVKRFYAFSTASYMDNKLYIAIGKSSESVYSELNKVLFINIVLLLFVLALGFIAASFFSNIFILRPITNLKNIAQKLSQKDFSVRSNEFDVNNEFGMLAQSFNIMAESIENHLTNQKKAEDSLRESSQLIQSIIDNSPSLIYILDLEGRFTMVSKKFLSIFGQSQENVLGYTREHIMPKEIAEQHRNNDLTIIKSQKIITFEEVNIEEDVKHYYFSQKFPLFDLNGNLYGVGGISSDLTERKLAEFELQESNERLKLILESNPIAIWDWNLKTDKWYVTQKYYTMLGYQPDSENMDRKVWLNRVHPDDRKSVRAKIEDVLNHKKEIYSYDARMLHADGSYRWQTVVGHIIERDENNNPLRLLGIRMDITDRKQAEDRLNNSYNELKETQRISLNLMKDLQSEIEVRKLIEKEKIKLNETLEQRVIERTIQLEAANKELEAFSYSVSHDLRAPLRHICGFADMLTKEVNEQLPDKAQHYLNIINDSALKMGTLIDDLLSFSRTSRAEMKKSVFNMNQLLEESINQVLISVENRNINWIISSLPDVTGDYNLLRQVWINLLENAVKYTRSRENTIISIDSYEENNDYVFSISDNGVGFDMRYAQKLFGVFQRLHSVNEFEGTGIGLANVRRIIIKHGGRTWAESEINKGAKFFFTLPKIGR